MGVSVMEIKQNIIEKGVQGMNKSLEIKTALRNQFKEGTSKIAKRICYGYAQDENGLRTMVSEISI